MTKAEARELLRLHDKALEHCLDKAVSQFQIRMCYVTKHDELLDIARSIVDGLDD